MWEAAPWWKELELLEEHQVELQQVQQVQQLQVEVQRTAHDYQCFHRWAELSHPRMLGTIPVRSWRIMTSSHEEVQMDTIDWMKLNISV